MGRPADSRHYGVETNDISPVKESSRDAPERRYYGVETNDISPVKGSSRDAVGDTGINTGT